MTNLIKHDLHFVHRTNTINTYGSWIETEIYELKNK